MEDTKQSLKRDYNEAIEKYNRGDLVGFFRNIRPAIEAFCKLVVYDLVGAQLAEQLLAGKQKIEVNYKTCSASIIPSDLVKAVYNSMLTTLAKQTIYYTKGKVLRCYTTNKTVEHLKKAIDSDFKALDAFFGSCSETGSHAGQSEIDKEHEARSLAPFFPKIFSDLRKFLSNETHDFLSELSQPNPEVVFQNSFLEQALQTYNDFLIFDELTNQMAQVPGVENVVILPELLTGPLHSGLSPEILADFFRIHWNFIVDLNPKTEEGLYENAPSEVKSSIRIITENPSEISGTSYLINWLFARGRSDLRVLDEKQTLRETPKLFSDSFSKIVKTGKTNDYLILDFGEDFPKLAQRLFNKLEDVFGSWESVASRCKIFSFTKNEDYKKMLTAWSEDMEIPVCFVSASFSDFLHHIQEIRNEEFTPSKNKLLIHNKVDLSESRERYKAAGIEFFGPSSISSEEKTWDFYAGAEITWEELDHQYDVTRDIYPVVRQRIVEIIKSTRRTQIFTLRHRPGSGASTLARRLAFDISKEAQMGILSCTVIHIRNCSNLKLTEDYLRQLSEITENATILAIVESKLVAKDKFDNLVQRISNAGKNVLFFYVEPYTTVLNARSSLKENVVLLDSVLKEDEMNRFKEKYLSLGLDKSLLERSSNLHTNLEVVDFPLMLRDKETSANLLSYVSEWMEVLPENLRKFCAYVGFIFKYSDFGVNQTLLKSLWKDQAHPSLRSYNGDSWRALTKLLVEEVTDEGKFTGVWRPRYNRFSEFLLKSYKSNWEDGIPEIAKDLINLCKNAGELGSDDRDMLYSVFIIRKNADYRAIEDRNNIRNKFSLLIKDLNDVERSESLFHALVDAFPHDSIFRGHFARFLYEKASMLNDINVDDRLFSDAQKNLDLAFELNSEDADLHHMQGMLLRRKMSTLSKTYDIEKQANLDEDPIQEIEDCLHDWTEDAYEAFERSIQLSPASPYGYAAESQLLKESITLGQKLLGCADFSFCETRPIYADYTERLGEVLDLFEQICYAFKADGLSQIMDSYKIYETVRAFHQNIIGQNDEAIQRYRTMYKTATKDKKALYGNLLVKSIVYSKKSSKDTRKAYSNLTKSERQEIEHVLEYQKNQGDIKSYETLFLLKLYGSDEFFIDEAIDLLKEWERQFTDESQVGWGYLNACFYLAICYCAKAIQADVPNKELSQLVMTYFRRSEELARKFDKGTVKELYYLGEKEDIHCIVDKNKKNTEACMVTGVIHHIKNNKGILKMKCGIEVSFNAKGFDILRDEGQTLKGILGFSYSGPGLYDFRPDFDEGLREVVMDRLVEKEMTFEELGHYHLSTEDLVEEPQLENASNPFPNSIKQVGFIDLEKYNRGGKDKMGANKQHKKLVDGEQYEGEIQCIGKYKIIRCQTFSYHLKMEGNEGQEFNENTKVVFIAKSRPNDKDENKKYWFAEKVRLKEE